MCMCVKDSWAFTVGLFCVWQLFLHSMAGSEGPDLAVVAGIGGGGDVLRKKDMEVMLCTYH